MARELSNQIGASRALALAALVSIAGCGSDAAPAGSDGGADATLDGAMDAAPFVFPEVPPFAAGAPITAAPLEWTYIPFDETRCMNNTPVGIGINPSATSADVIIVFQGGNLCFDLTSCITVANLSGFDAADLGPTVSYMESGIFSRTDLDNPMRDWNFVFIPYCSGDLHAGNHPASYRNRAYMGFSNTRAFLSRIVPTFADAGRVVVAGSSAGGFGALANYDQTVAAFQSVGSAARIHLLDDAGPPMGDDYLRACFQQQLRDVFGLDSTPLIERCPECSGPMGGGLGQIAPFVAGQHPDFRMGLLATEGDSVIRSFFGYGYSPRCDLPTNMPIDEYQAGLYEMRDVILAPHPNFKFFVAPGEFHTFLGQPLGATRSSVGGITVGEWIRQLIDEDPAWDHLGP